MEEKEITAAKEQELAVQKKKRSEDILSKYTKVASEMPAEWVKAEENRIEMVKTIHRDILGLDKQGKMRPMSDFIRFMTIASQAGLNPFKNEVFAIYYHDKSIGADRLTVVTGINGFRKAAAEDTTAVMRYVGSGEPEFEMKSVKPWWAKEDEEVPHKCTVAIKGLNPITGEVQDVAVGIAYWDEYVKLVDEYENNKKTGRKIPNTTWRDKKMTMLSKVAEAAGLRKAYPNRFSAVYNEAEFDRTINQPEKRVDSESERANVIEEQLAKRRKSRGGVFAQEAEVVENA